MLQGVLDSARSLTTAPTAAPETVEPEDEADGFPLGILLAAVIPVVLIVVGVGYFTLFRRRME